MSKRNHRRVLPACLPDDVLHDGFDDGPSWEEIALEYHTRKLIELRAEMQRDWLQEQLRRVSQAAQEIEQYKREAQLAELHERQDEWFRQEAAENSKLRTMYQEILDRPTLKKLRDRVNKAGKQIAADAARWEREALQKRGVYRGR
jgi:hypothetical protein